MKLTKYKLGDLIEQLDLRNSDNLYKEDDVVGLSTQKKMIETKADLKGVKLTSYKVFPSNYFAYVSDTSRRGNKISLAFNNTNKFFLVSSISTVFKVSNENKLLPAYLFMYFNRAEFDRYSRFNSWGSARETFDYSEMCDINMQLPPLEIQQKYVDIYNSMVKNQQSYERGLEDLKLVCEAYIENLRREYPLQAIGKYIEEREETNSDLKYDELVGVGNEGFITPRGNRKKSTFNKCNIFYPNDFIYNPSVISKGAIVLNLKYDLPKLCTEEYIVFYVKNGRKLLPEYLFMWLKRRETGRYMDFINIDSVRNRVYFKDLSNIEIPIPSLDIQTNICNIYKVYYERKSINEKLKAQIKNICPILIRGSIEEAKSL